MSKNALLILMTAFVAISFACTTTETPKTNANTNATAANQTNLPAEFKTEPVPPSGNMTPGIPDSKTINANNVPKGATPTPGIPDPAKMTPVPKGATPTPGIPDAATLKKQRNSIPMSGENPASTLDSNSNSKQRVRKP